MIGAGEVGDCPICLWYFVATFRYTLLVLVLLVAYLIMYSTHFMWVLKKRKGPLGKKTSKTSKTVTQSRESRESGENKESKEIKEDDDSAEKHAASPAR